MLFAFICRDKPDGGLELRISARPDHLAWLEGLGETLKFAGPFMDDTGEVMCGSLVVVEAENIDEARQLSTQDPFFKSGVFDQVEVKAWKWTVRNPEVV